MTRKNKISAQTLDYALYKDTVLFVVAGDDEFVRVTDFAHVSFKCIYSRVMLGPYFLLCYMEQCTTFLTILSHQLPVALCLHVLPQREREREGGRGKGKRERRQSSEEYTGR